MKIVTRYHGPVAILGLEGPLTHGVGDTALRGAVLDLLNEGYDKILIDLGSVRKMDSSGLGELVRCRTTCEDHEAEVKLLRLHPKVYSLISVSQLVGLFEIYESEADALPSFWHDMPSNSDH